MNASLVSIVVPVYNVEKYLHECLDSIITQTYKNLEIILVNDGSTDSSGKIADKYASKDKRITVIHKKNEGQPKTKNLGIKLATGRFITFVDSDDYIREDYVENLVNDMIKYNVLIATTTKMCPIDYDNSEKVEVYDQPKAFEKMFYGTLENAENGVQMYDRRLLLEKGIFSNPEKKIGEDFDFLAQALLHADKIAVDNRRMYYYRPNPTSLMNQKINADIMKSIKTFSSIGDRLIDKYPGMRRSVDAKKFNDSVALAIRGYVVRKEWRNDFMELWKNIERLKWQIMFDGNARRKVRLAAVIYCVFGNNLGTIIIRRIKK